MTGTYSVQSSVARPTHGPHVKNRTLENKSSRSHYKILSKLTVLEILSMTDSYFVQSSVAIPTRGPHFKSRTLKIKARVHTIKFYQN